MTKFDRAVGRINPRKDPIIPIPKPFGAAGPAVDEAREAPASVDRVDLVIAVFALGVLFGMWIA